MICNGLLQRGRGNVDGVVVTAAITCEFTRGSTYNSIFQRPRIAKGGRWTSLSNAQCRRELLKHSEHAKGGSQQ